MSKEINEKIVAIYSEWLDKILPKEPSLFTDEFSNIFCTGIPSNWEKAEKRILIVGEEATWGSRDNPGNKYETYKAELKECQEWILNDLNDKLHGKTRESCKRSPFWRRIRKIQDVSSDAVFCWTNIDVLNTKFGKKLSEADRKKLHSGNTILEKVVELIAPTHILFCGWHNTSLKHEFPSLYKEVCPCDSYKSNQKFWKENNYLISVSENNKKFIFTYHPSWAKANSDSYIDKILKELEV